MRRLLLRGIKAVTSFLVVGANNWAGSDGSPPPLRRTIPGKVLIGYASHSYENVRKAVTDDGVNVVIWAFMEISTDTYDHRQDEWLQSSRRTLSTNASVDGDRQVKTGLDLAAIASLIEDLDDAGFSHVPHLVSFGGWNGPHLDPLVDAQEWFAIWNASAASSIFHGIDWDLEGNDDRQSPNNYFTIECLEKMGEIGRLMKEGGYIVHLAPPQSYLNLRSSNFSRYVNLTDPNRGWHGDFSYFGANVYGYLLAKYGDCIDLVSIQLYESFSDAALSIHHDGTAASEYLFSLVQNLARNNASVHIDFSQDANSGLAERWVDLPLSKLVIGLANGWAMRNPGEKTLFIAEADCKTAYLRLKCSEHGDITPRGFMVWTLNERGSEGVYLARDIGNFLHS
ncbi:hypothetical protein ACHAXT_012231 [Thalassiosira profunda]